MMPNVKTSDLHVNALRAVACSGDMYPRVPQAPPVRVRDSRVVCRAMPKSINIAYADVASITF